jgi:KUP system potassium uptake protein
MSQPQARNSPTVHDHQPHFASKKELAGVSLGALGVVYGDIGTSPLYSINECLIGPHSVGIDHDNVLGVLSLMFWALTIMVVVKYLTFVLRVDNKGEGGILAIAALLMTKRKEGENRRGRPRLLIPVMLALFAAGMLYGDGVITPAISVLSAIEGLKQVTDSLDAFVVPITLVIITALFLVQRHGTHRIGRVFGWVMLVWFLTLAVLGLRAVFGAPQVLAAVNPYYAVRFFINNGFHGFLLLGSVVLCITGSEALYADLGHFGRTPIRVAWYVIVFPGVLLSYFGQGALLLANEGSPEPITNAFFGLAPGALMVPMVILAAMAAVIASQAMISGVFSITRAAVQLGYFPRVTVIHTSDKAEGQIYIPEMNFLMMTATIALVLGFQSSTNLAAAYGIAATGTMTITTILFGLIARDRLGWKLSTTIMAVTLFLTIDLAFLAANTFKIPHGGWFPLALGAAVFIIMTTWWRGRIELSDAMGGAMIPDDLFLMDIAESKLPRVPGTAVFMASTTQGIPNVLMHHVKHNKVLHNQVILLSIVTERVPWVRGENSIEVRDLGHGFFRIVARVGFMQTPLVPKILAGCDGTIAWNEPDTTYYLGRQTLLVTGRSKMAKWRKMLFSFLSRNARPPTNFFGLPPNRVVELGLQIEL